MEIRNAQARSHCLAIGGGVLVMNLQPEAPSEEFAIVTWYQVSCSYGFVRDSMDVSTT